MSIKHEFNWYDLPQWKVYKSLTKKEQGALMAYATTGYQNINYMLSSGEYQELSASGQYDNIEMDKLRDKIIENFETKGYNRQLNIGKANAYIGIKLITSAFEKVEPLTSAITVWRGVHSDEWHKIDYTDDESIEKTSRDDYQPEPWRVPDFTRVSFISTTADMSYALYSFVSYEPEGSERPGCCLMEILISPGSKILPLKPGYSTLHESEVLLPYWGQLILTNTEIRDISYSSPKTEEKIRTKVRVYQLTYIP